MKFLECGQLNRLNVLLKHVNLGDKILEARFELFDGNMCAATHTHTNANTDTHTHSGTKSKSNTHTHTHASKELLVNLISSMNDCFPDYDFSTISPASLIHENDFSSVYNNIQYHMSFMLEPMLPGILREIWTAIKSAISLNNLEIYSYNAAEKTAENPFQSSDCLFSFDYFFYDRANKRILFFGCLTRNKFIRHDASSQNSSTGESHVDTEAFDTDEDALNCDDVEMDSEAACDDEDSDTQLLASREIMFRYS